MDLVFFRFPILKPYFLDSTLYFITFLVLLFFIGLEYTIVSYYRYYISLICFLYHEEGLVGSQAIPSGGPKPQQSPY